ncbi:MAG TPA: iron-containing redox enzyme family protein [Polyangiaceae bacterium]|nr:iron-containing redox enzyme family protein [Polyangiaceae bacterium]
MRLPEADLIRPGLASALPSLQTLPALAREARSPSTPAAPPDGAGLAAATREGPPDGARAGLSGATREGPPALAPDELHARLGAFNRRRLEPSLGVDADAWEGALRDEVALRRLEAAFVEGERRAVAALAQGAPREPDAFVAWFEGLAAWGPGQGDPLFDWLATEATAEQMRWFLRQEVAGEAGFDELVALTQVRFPARAKLEMARNYWDEMGQGHPGAMHGPMLDALAREVGVEADPSPIVWEARALANLLVALASNRHYAYQSVGALGAVELTAPGRAARVNEGLKRLGVAPAARRYFALHATLDVKHSAAWNREVIGPLVAADPRAAAPLAEGALLRLAAGARCFERYRRELGLTPRQS